MTAQVQDRKAELSLNLTNLLTGIALLIVSGASGAIWYKLDEMSGKLSEAITQVRVNMSENANTRAICDEHYKVLGDRIRRLEDKVDK